MDWAKEDVGFYALHQANEFMVNYVRKKLKVAVEVAPANCKDYGNTGPATIPFLLSDVCSQKQYDLKKTIMVLVWGCLGVVSLLTFLKQNSMNQLINKTLCRLKY